MPGLAAQRNGQISNNGFYSNGFWSKNRGDDVSYNQLQKFWSELSPQARQNLLRIDKQTLFDHARKKMYCSRCNGLLLEGFLQIVMHGKSLHQDSGGGGNLPCNRPGATKYQMESGSWNMSIGCPDGIQDPSVHPWGGLTTTRDGSLTLLDCYSYGKSLKEVQNVFDSARGREQERELLYPDACGGAGRGWISQGITGCGRGHGTREACALHTARLSCDTLVDFWSALGEETRQSLLRMKEEDFVERLMYRFDSKRFCRDCRRNVIREFKELKELKRMRREPHCTSWFCVADAAFQYEVSDDTVQADWCQSFPETFGTYHYFEWAVGTGEGKSDIVGFENVGMSRSVKVSGLDLGGLSACFITLRAWKMDGRCTELCVKAHALNGQQCVHCRLVVGDGLVTITRGESIRCFFEHAEEAEEEEDDDAVDKDGNELDGECSRPQKHAKSPELAREFLLDAATVIFKEQVEKAFREGTARQNAHSIFVCLALKLLEERVHVACKEIITLEKQMKLLEEEEKEKREEEERKERKRMKEREKKLRRKERSKGKDKDKEKRSPDSNENLVLPDIPPDVASQKVDEECTSAISCVDSVSETGDLSMPESPDIQDKRFSNGYITSLMQKDSCDNTDWEGKSVKHGRVSFTFEELRFSHPKKNFRRDFQLNSSVKWSDRYPSAVTESGVAAYRSESRNHGDNFWGCTVSNRQSRMNGRFIFDDKFHSRNNKMNDSHSCSCHQKSEYRVKVEPHVSTVRVNRESRSGSSLDMSKQFYRGNRYFQMDYKHEGCGRPKGKSSTLNSSGRDMLNSKKVWEPSESQKRYLRCNLDTDVTLTSSTFNVDGVDPDVNQSCGDSSSMEAIGSSCEVDQDEKDKKETRISSVVTDGLCQSGGHMEVKELCFASETVYEEVSSCPVENCLSSGTSDPSLDSCSSSDNFSSCLSEGDNSPSSSNLGTLESSSTSDSEDGSHQIGGGEALQCTKNGFSNGHEVDMAEKTLINRREADGKLFEFPLHDSRVSLVNLPTKAGGLPVLDVDYEHQVMFPAMHNNLQFTMFQAPSTMGYYHHNHVSWPATPTDGYVSFSHDNPYLYASPFAYGYQGNPGLCAEYGPAQHLATPSFNSGSMSVYQAGPKLDSKGQLKTSMVQELVAETNSELMTPVGLFPAEKPVNGSGKPGDSAKLQAKNSNFSLFHFSGPVELSKCCKSDSYGVVGSFSSKISKDQVENDPSCNKLSTMEEYNLFATSNGLSFSIF